MNPFSAWKQQLIRRLAARLGPQGILVGEAFTPAAHRPWEQGRRVAVGIAGLELPGATRVVKVTLRLELLAPKDDPGGCYEVFEALSQELGEGDYGVSRLECGEAAYRQELDCLCCTARAELRGVLASEGDPQGWQRLVIRTEEVL